VGLLEAALGLLAPELDAEQIAKGEDESHRYAVLLAHLSAWALFGQDNAAQDDARMTVAEVADVHADADLTVAETIAAPEAVSSAVLHLQILRLVWVHHALLALREEPDPLVDAALAALNGIVDLLTEAQSGETGGAGVREALRRAEAMLDRAHRMLGDD
jgi:hypothetical protein